MVRMIALIRVNNLADVSHYRERAPATLETYGGEIRFRAEKPTTLGDENALGDFLQIALFWFPTLSHWYESDAKHDLWEFS